MKHGPKQLSSSLKPKFINQILTSRHLTLSVDDDTKNPVQRTDTAKDTNSQRQKMGNENGKPHFINVTPLTTMETHRQVWECYCRWRLWHVSTW